MSNQDLIAPRFYVEAVEDKKASLEAGRPIFKDMEFCEVKFAADKQRIHVAPAHEVFKRDRATNEPVTYAMEYAPIYQKFKANEAQDAVGTPLTELPFLTAAKRSELKALSIRNAEALASLDGEPLRRLGMGGRALKDQAQAYLDKASGSAMETRLAAENAGLRDQMAEMQAQLAELIAAGKGKPVKEDETIPASPFDDFADEDIRNWLEGGGFEVDGRWGRKKLVEKANEANATLAEKNKAA